MPNGLSAASIRASSTCCTRITDVTTFIAVASPNRSSHSSAARSIGSNGSRGGRPSGVGLLTRRSRTRG